MSNKNIDLIRQALNASESSIKLARQLLADLEAGQGAGNNVVSPKPKAAELPGVLGVFDGENMVTESGENFPVPANYASKSLLVVGDTLKLVEEGKEKRFKQIEHLKRHKTTGILTKKDGKWKVVTPEGSYKVLPAAVSHFGADVGDEVVLHLPATNLTVPWGAIESVKGEAKASEIKEKELKDEKPAEKKVEKKAKEEVKIEKPLEVVEKKEPAKKEEAPKPKEEKKVEAKTPEPKKDTVVEALKEKPEPVAVVAKEVPKPTPTPPAAPVVTPTPAVPMEVAPEEDELT